MKAVKNIPCEDCGATGMQTSYCTDPMCREPETCAGPPRQCTTCKGTKIVVPDDINRYWAVPHYSASKRRAIKEQDKAAKLRRLKEETIWTEQEIWRMEREIIKLRRELSKRRRKLETARTPTSKAHRCDHPDCEGSKR